MMYPPWIGRLLPAIASFASLLLPRAAEAQWNLARLESGQTYAHATLGVDPAAIGGIGGTRTLALWGRTAILRADGSVAVGGRDMADCRVRLAGDVPVIHRGALRVSLALGAVNRGTSNTVFRANGVGVDAQTNGGLYGRRAFAALEVGTDRAIVTRFVFTDRYRANVPTARDGWYAATAATDRAGVAVGLTATRVELLVRAGIVRTPGGEGLIPPAYLTFGVGRRF